MIQIKRYDHISMAVPDLDPQIAIMERLFGFRFDGTFENDEGYFGANMAIPGSSNVAWEILAPRGADSYLHRFLAGPSGPGLHHVALQIESTAQAAGVITAEGMEPWGHRAEADDGDGRGVIYLHPRSGGRGFLWQMYAGDPWNTTEPFEDERSDTLGIIAVNHLAHAARDRHELAGWYERVFGMRTVWESPGDGHESGFRTRVLEAHGGQLRFEVIEPSRNDSFIAKYLDTRGETMHHLTFEVRDFEQAVAACQAQNAPIFGSRSGVRDGARWSEAFVHPRHTGGILVQFFWQERPGTWI
jgi:methylmalonyl-CoA/ethylmalonyl-CoA epimerase